MVSEEEKVRSKDNKLGQAGPSWAKLGQAGPLFMETMKKEAKGKRNKN